MDPQSLEDALDLSRDKLQNQVCYFLIFLCLKSELLTWQLIQGSVYLPARKAWESYRRATLEATQGLLYLRSRPKIRCSMLCALVKWRRKRRVRAIATQNLQTDLVCAGAQDSGANHSKCRSLQLIADGELLGYF